MGVTKHIGSTIALVLGILLVVAGLSQLNDRFISGAVIILGALAYRSAKKRKLGAVESTSARKTLEFLAIILAMAAVFLQNNLLSLIEQDPFPNVVIPLWVLIAFIIVILKAPR